ncbi:MAG: hypothetical protein EXS48_02755 [Candidatus Staskawiczbacteria bacterium]|nr:hypothetical protein [Candidatus Staskawiczbacteria bacterium]
MKNTLDYVLEIIRDFHDQYKKYPAGSKIRFETYLGEDGTEKSHEDDDNGEAVDAFNLRLKAINQLHEEGLILDYKIDQRYDQVYEYKVAECLVDRSKLLEHVLRIGNGENSTPESEDSNEDHFNDGISSPYQNTESELFILKKILLEHKRRDDAGFAAKELSFSNNSLEEICSTINRTIEDGILWLSANTRPERFDDQEGLQVKNGLINWNVVKKLNENPGQMDNENGLVNFDIEVLDEVKLKGRIDIGIEEFMNDKVYSRLGYMMDKHEANELILQTKNEPDKQKKAITETFLVPQKISHPYNQQRAILIEALARNKNDEQLIPLNSFHDPNVEVLKTLLALEKENLLRIKELKSNPIWDDTGIIGKWFTRDNPIARIQLLKSQENPKEAIIVKIAEMPELKIKGLKTLPNAKKKTDKITVFLNEAGDLFREPKTKYCYAMGQKDDRHKIVRFLLANKGYQETRQIAAQFEDKSEESIGSEIGKINSKAQGKLGLNEKENMILGKRGSGYRINPAYKFAFKNE